MRRTLGAAAIAAALSFSSSRAGAFCGFYVGGEEAKLYNDATRVVVMRDGTRTVLSMQNHYQGPLSDFAMVVPVPVVLKKENVKTLPHELFARVDALTAPRLVEYWEQDPCGSDGYGYEFADDPLQGGFGPNDATIRVRPGAMRAVVKLAEFTVAEYDVVVLSANDSTALDEWIRDHGYKIPAGAAPFFAPYVQAGWKFFVAKVNASRVRQNGKETMLSPLRFQYDAESFRLPVRLGLINARGAQDLIVTILARGQRYEVANYDNVAIPTNLEVSEATHGRFAALYAAVFDRTLESKPRAVVTEYAWDTASCDPCPQPPLAPEELSVLGADVMGVGAAAQAGFVITRLHARYTKETLADDLVFRAAPPIEGGREGDDSSAKASSMNNFQGRYVIRHPWTGAVTCEAPRRGRWGSKPEVTPATDVAFAPRGGLDLAAFVRGGLPDAPTLSKGDGSAPAIPPAPRSGGCAGCAVSSSDATGLGAIVALIAGAFLKSWRARRRP